MVLVRCPLMTAVRAPCPLRVCSQIAAPRAELEAGVAVGRARCGAASRGAAAGRAA